MAVTKPANVAPQLVGRVEAAALDQAFSKTERHRGVVGPLPGHEAERAAADHLGQRLERSRTLELERRSECVTDGEAEERTERSVFEGGHLLSRVGIGLSSPVVPPPAAINLRRTPVSDL